MKNYMEIRGNLPWRKNFMFIDTSEHLADKLFIDKEVNIKFEGEYVQKGNKFICVMASCNSRDWDKVVEALSLISDKMLIFGYTDYEDYCNSFMEKFNERNC